MNRKELVHLGLWFYELTDAVQQVRILDGVKLEAGEANFSGPIKALVVLRPDLPGSFYASMFNQVRQINEALNKFVLSLDLALECEVEFVIPRAQFEALVDDLPSSLIFSNEDGFISITREGLLSKVVPLKTRSELNEKIIRLINEPLPKQRESSRNKEKYFSPSDRLDPWYF